MAVDCKSKRRHYWRNTGFLTGRQGWEANLLDFQAGVVGEERLKRVERTDRVVSFKWRTIWKGAISMYRKESEENTVNNGVRNAWLENGGAEDNALYKGPCHRPKREFGLSLGEMPQCLFENVTQWKRAGVKVLRLNPQYQTTHMIFSTNSSYPLTHI